MVRLTAFPFFAAVKEKLSPVSDGICSMFVPRKQLDPVVLLPSFGDRREAWLKSFSSAENVRMKTEDTDADFGFIEITRSKPSARQLSLSERKRIEKDVDRSELKSAALINDLREVCSRLAIDRDGYVQGMNIIAAEFLNEGFSVEEAFSGVSFFLDEVGPDFYDETFSGLNRIFEKLPKMLTRVNKAVALQIQSLDDSYEAAFFIRDVLMGPMLKFFVTSLSHDFLVAFWNYLITASVNKNHAYVAAVAAFVSEAKHCYMRDTDSPYSNRTCLLDYLKTLKTDEFHVWLKRFQCVLNNTADLVN
jgi:hypothetical protein